ncbi:hypothetical protein DFH28DRAFT_932156 [Melampsora americana]|nr:hypothetical protein DFH28DRAFT_932156 [Melampsora americana]
MTKVCLLVCNHESGFIKCLTMLNNPSIDTPKINKEVDGKYFSGNKFFVKILLPIVNSLAQLEPADNTLGDIWKELGNVYCSIQDIKIYEQFNPLKKHALSSLHLCSKQFQLDIYLFAFFLDAAYGKVATSKEYTNLNAML